MVAHVRRPSSDMDQNMAFHRAVHKNCFWFVPYRISRSIGWGKYKKPKRGRSKKRQIFLKKKW